MPVPAKRGLWLTSVLAGGLLAGPTAASAVADVRSTTLAQSVPADARLFLEIRGTASLSATPAGSALGRLVGGLMTTTAPATSQPAQAWGGWHRLFAEAVGLDSPRATDLLFTGPVALVACKPAMSRLTCSTSASREVGSRCCLWAR